MVTRITYRVGPGGAAEEYAAHQEFGTSKMSAQPYMRPAFEAHRDSIPSEVERVLTAIIAANRIR